MQSRRGSKAFQPRRLVRCDNLGAPTSRKTGQ